VHLEALFEDELVVIMAPDHPLAGTPHLPLEAFAGEHVFAYTSEDRHSTVLDDILAPAGVVPARVSRIQLTEAIIELVAAGLGISVLANWSVAPAVRAGSVCASRLGVDGHSRTWSAAVRRGDVMPAFQFDLIELVRRHMRGADSGLPEQRLRLS
jgi:LysR family transcriptional regulator for metE and metH